MRESWQKREREREPSKWIYDIFPQNSPDQREDEPSPLISPLSRPPRFESATCFQRSSLRPSRCRPSPLLLPSLRSKSRMESYEDEWSLTGGRGLSVMDPQVQLFRSFVQRSRYLFSVLMEAELFFLWIPSFSSRNNKPENFLLSLFIRTFYFQFSFSKIRRRTRGFQFIIGLKKCDILIKRIPN